MTSTLYAFPSIAFPFFRTLQHVFFTFIIKLKRNESALKEGFMLNVRVLNDTMGATNINIEVWYEITDVASFVKHQILSLEKFLTNFQC